MTKEPFWSNKKTNTHFFFSFNPLCIKSFSRLTAHSPFYMLSLPTPPALRVVGVEPSCLQVTTWSFFLRSPIQKPPFKFLLSPRRFSIQFALMFSCAQLLCTKTFQGQFKEPPIYWWSALDVILPRAFEVLTGFTTRPRQWWQQRNGKKSLVATVSSTVHSYSSNRQFRANYGLGTKTLKYGQQYL